jgi:hypothetical protein
MSNEIKARSCGASDSSGGKAKASPKWEPFDGVLTVSDGDFTRFMACMTNPGEPTVGARRGAALLKKLKR